MWWRSDVIKRHLWHVRRLTCNNSMAYLKNWTDNFFQIFIMGTSWVAVSINNITTRASREITSRKNIKFFDFNGVNVAKHWHVAGEVFAISDCLVLMFDTSLIYILTTGGGGGGGVFWMKWIWSILNIYLHMWDTSTCLLWNISYMYDAISSYNISTQQHINLNNDIYIPLNKLIKK